MPIVYISEKLVGYNDTLGGKMHAVRSELSPRGVNNRLSLRLKAIAARRFEETETSSSWLNWDAKRWPEATSASHVFRGSTDMDPPKHIQPGGLCYAWKAKCGRQQLNFVGKCVHTWRKKMFQQHFFFCVYGYSKSCVWRSFLKFFILVCQYVRGYLRRIIMNFPMALALVSQREVTVPGSEMGVSWR